MNKMLMKEKNVEKEKECWVISESNLSQISTKSLTSSNQYAVNSLAFTVNWLELQPWYTRNIISVTSVPRLNKAEALINSHQVWPRYDSDMAQHPFPSPTLFSFTNTLFTYITFFPCHKHIPFRPSAASEHYINRSFCTNLLLYS